MDKKEILKNFTIGFIPLLIFIIVDEFYGTRAGLIAAIAVGAAEFAFYYIRDRRIESFVLFDVILIIAMGTVSILLDNEIFFKLKPALIELILLILLGIHAFSQKPLLLMMGKRFLKNITVNDLQMKMMQKMSRLIFFIILVHIILIVYAAYYMSNESWAFIAGGLFYIIFGVILGLQWLYFKFKKQPVVTYNADGDEEWFDIVDEKGKVLNKEPRSAVHGNPQLLHPVVHLQIFNNQGLLYLQKRAMSKEVQPGKWDTAVGGHIQSGEDVMIALKREAFEELGIKSGVFQPLFRYVMRNNFESELVYSFQMLSNGPFNINPNEIIFGKFWRIADVENNLGKDIFTPNFEQEFALLRKIIKSGKSKKRK